MNVVWYTGFIPFILWVGRLRWDENISHEHPL